MPSNYRPISLTSSCCKIFESVILFELLKFLNVNKVITPSQHGFLEGRSTCTNLIESLNDWSGILNKSQEALILYVDFCKAFDSVSIPKLLHKLKTIGVDRMLLDCISYLLNNRLQRVRVGSSLSPLRPVMSGVPQGSIIGPTMFLLFINDLESFLPNSVRSKLFADDLKSYISIANDKYIDDFNLLISGIQQWSETWQLPLSIVNVVGCCYLIAPPKELLDFVSQISNLLNQSKSKI